MTQEQFSAVVNRGTLETLAAWFCVIFYSGSAPTHTITITVTNYTMTVTYLDPNEAPRVITTSPVEVPPPIPSKVSLVASVDNDVNGVYTQFLWEQVSGPNTAIINSPTTLLTDIQITTYAIGTWEFRLTATAPATPTSNATSITGTVLVLINAPRAPIVENLTMAVIYSDTAFLAPSVNDDGWSGPVTYAWTKVFEPTTGASLSSASTRTTTATFPEFQGTWKFQLAASNNEFTGIGIASVTNYAGVGPPAPSAQDLYVTIAGIERVTGA